MDIDELRKLDVRIAQLCSAAEHFPPHPGDHTLEFWYTLFKPRVSKLVGWGRKFQDRETILGGIQVMPDFISEENRKILKSTQAYDCLYQYCLGRLEEKAQD